MSQPLLLDERHALIREKLRSEGRVLAAELAEALSVSEDTIRRDLRNLAAAGICRKVYGGAIAPAPVAGTLRQRLGKHSGRKAALAAAAAALVRPGSLIFLDAGSTNFELARKLPSDANLRIATNAPAIAALLHDRASFEIILVGGVINPRTGSCFDAAAVAMAASLRPDLCFLGACGVDASHGVSAFDFDDAQFKQRIAQASADVAVLTTNEKLGTAAPFAVLGTEDLGHLVVEADASATALAGFAEQGVTVTVAKAERG